MNILQILPELNVGGVETGTIDLSKFLKKQGHNPVVVSNGGVLVSELEDCGIKHYSLPVHDKSLFVIIRMVKAVVKVVREENIHIIHCRSRVPAWIGYFASRLTKVPFITTCHGCYSKHVFSSVMGWGKLVIAPSNAIAVDMVENFKVPYQRIRVIPRSVDSERFKFLPPEKRNWEVFNIGIIGRVTPIKGHIDFLKAMAKVARVYPGIKIWIVGAAPASKKLYMEELLLLSRRLGLAKHTKFLGSQKDVPAVLSQLNILVLATHTQEAFGRVIIEAQVSGVPVVATEVGGVVDIIRDGQTGLLVPAKDTDKMAEAVLRLVNDEPLRNSLIYAANEDARSRFTVANMGLTTLRVYQEAIDKTNLLIIKFGAIGDLILSVPAIRALREKFGGNCRISFVVGREGKPILDKCPYVDEIIVYDHKKIGWRGFLKLAKYLRKKCFDMVIDLQNNRKSHLLSFLTLSAKRYGYDNKKWGFLLNFRASMPAIKIPPVEHQFRILKMLGIELMNPKLELWVSEDDRARINDFLNSYFVIRPKYLAAINLGASRRWNSKQWPKEHIIKLINELAARGIVSLLIGQEYQRGLENAVYSKCAGVKPVPACGKTSLAELFALISRCDVLISPDSAPLHIAAALNIPFVALFGPTDCLRHMPPAERFVLLKKDIKCSPCYKPDCRRNKCMSGITVDEVFSAVEGLLGIKP